MQGVAALQTMPSVHVPLTNGRVDSCSGPLQCSHMLSFGYEMSILPAFTHLRAFRALLEYTSRHLQPCSFKIKEGTASNELKAFIGNLHKTLQALLAQGRP
jgi:hypothetical protein